AIRFVVVAGPEGAKNEGAAAQGTPANMIVVTETGEGLQKRIARIIQEATPMGE
ncbi:hypothetical protein I3W98_24925, partial [Streptomyces cavourensis]|nr:hypothetical protein [Streptomyces cavourensis]